MKKVLDRWSPFLVLWTITTVIHVLLWWTIPDWEFPLWSIPPLSAGMAGFFLALSKAHQ